LHVLLNWGMGCIPGSIALQLDNVTAFSFF
jgi:hypothetical protein